MAVSAPVPDRVGVEVTVPRANVVTGVLVSPIVFWAATVDVGVPVRLTAKVGVRVEVRTGALVEVLTGEFVRTAVFTRVKVGSGVLVRTGVWVCVLT